MTDTTNPGTPEDAQHNADAPQGAENGSPNATPPENQQFYQQAVALCTRAADAGALQEALLWAQQAERIGSVLQPDAAMPEVTRAYARIMLEACLISQERALTSGNILVQHGELAEIISITSERLGTTLERAEPQPRMLALMAQGFAKQHSMRLRTNLKERYYPRYHDSKPADLDHMLETLSNIERCATELCGPQHPTLPFDRKLAIAQTAVSNARFSLTRFFSSQLSDWAMAEFFCRRAFSLLTTRSIESSDEQVAASGNAELDTALNELPGAYAALKRRSYRDSSQRLGNVEQRLSRAHR